ncbi:MAG TPA: hypothetical protein VH482_01535 [Thermomicrobiales bacterium]|jgi:hypothetical protein
MRRSPLSALAVAVLLAGLALPVAVVRAQTPVATPAPGARCISDNEDPTVGNAIEFVRLAGPPTDGGDGPSLYQVNIADDGSAVYRPGCDAVAEAVSVLQDNTVYLAAFEGETVIYAPQGDRDKLLAQNCTPISEKNPAHEGRFACTLATDGVAVQMTSEYAAFHNSGATYAYAASEDAIKNLQAQSTLVNANTVGAVSRPANAPARRQAGADPSILVSSGYYRASGCGGECQ